MNMNLCKKAVCLSLFFGCYVGASDYGKVKTTDDNIIEMVEAVAVTPSAPPGQNPDYNSARDYLRSFEDDSSSVRSSSSDSDPAFCLKVMMGGFIFFVGYEFISMLNSEFGPKKYQIYNQDSVYRKILYRPEYHTCKNSNGHVDCVKYIAPGKDITVTSYGHLEKLCVTYDAWDNLHQKCADKDKLKTHSSWCVHDNLTFIPGECPSSMVAYNLYTSNDLSPEFVQPNLRGSIK